MGGCRYVWVGEQAWVDGWVDEGTAVELYADENMKTKFYLKSFSGRMLYTVLINSETLQIRQMLMKRGAGGAPPSFITFSLGLAMFAFLVNKGRKLHHTMS